MSDQPANRPKPTDTKQFLLLLLKKIWATRKLYLLPLWALLLAVALILIVSGHGYILPAIYIAF